MVEASHAGHYRRCRRTWGAICCFSPWLLAGAAITAPAHVERGSLVYENIPEAPAELSAKMDSYFSGREAAPLGWSAKGELLIATRSGEVPQLHLLDRPDGARRQITFRQDPVAQGGFSPDPARRGFFFLEDADGSDRAQLYYQHLGESQPKLLSDGRSVNSDALWSSNGKMVAFCSTVRDGVSHDIYIVDPELGVLPRLVTAGDSAAWRPLDWSPDDRKLLVLKTNSLADSHLLVVDIATGQKREIEPVKDRAAIADARFSRDGAGVYLISDRDSEFAQLYSVNLFTSERSALAAHLPGDVQELAVSRDAHYLAFTSNEGGVDKLNLLDLKAKQVLSTPPPLSSGLIGHLRFDDESKRLAFSFESLTTPREAYVLDVAADKVEAWTRSDPGAVDTGRFVVPRLVQFQGFDRARPIPVYVYAPAGAAPHPVLLLLHDGPEAQFRPGFDPWIQFVVNELGYAVVAPNLRGSTGYGKTYSALDDGMLREDVVKDLGALIVGLTLRSEFDAKHVVIAGICCGPGDSYGGYLALAALTNYGDRLSGAIDPAGISDFVSFLATTAPDRQGSRRAEYGDERDPDTRGYLRRISPLTNADRVSKPLLVIQGKNDARTPPAESEQLVNRLRSRGLEVWYLEAKNEGHDFRRHDNGVAYYRTVAQFLQSLH